MSGFNDYALSMQMRDTIDRMVEAKMDAVRPRYRYATVVSYSRATGKCTIIFNGEANPVIVNMGSIQPTSVGQTVRVDGIGTDKFITDIVSVLADPPALGKVGIIDPYYTSGLAMVTWSGDSAKSGPYPFQLGYIPTGGDPVIGTPSTNGFGYILTPYTFGVTYPVYWTPTLGASWVNYGSGYGLAGVTKTTSGIVMLRGLIRNGSAAAATTLFILPVGFRPANRKILHVVTNGGAGRVDIDSSGAVVLMVSDTGWTSLDGIMFLEASAENALTWTPLALYAGWVTLAGWTGVVPARAIDSYGRVWHRGVVSRTSGSSGPIWDVSAAFSPGNGRVFMARVSSNNNIGAIDINPSSVAQYRFGSVSYMSLDNLVYPGPAINIQNGWNRIGFQNGWANYYTGAPWSDFGLFKSADGLVLSVGLIKGGTAYTVFDSVPAGFRPKNGTLLYPAYCSGASGIGRIDIGVLGAFQTSTPTDTGFVSMDLAYIAEQ